MNESTPANRMIEVAGQMAAAILGETANQGIQGKMMRPMITNYLALLTSANTEQKTLDLCERIRAALDYVEYGAGVFRNNLTRQERFDSRKECNNCGPEIPGYEGCMGCGVQEEIDGEVGSGNGELVTGKVLIFND